MYIHLGNDQVIAGDQVIVILNLEDEDQGQYAAIIEKARRAKQLHDVSNHGKKKALVLCSDRVYLSPISSNTLCKRASNYHREDY